MKAFMNARSLLNPQRVFSSTFWLSVSTFETIFYITIYHSFPIIKLLWYVPEKSRRCKLMKNLGKIVSDMEICPLNRINYIVHVRKPYKMGHQNYEPSLHIMTWIFFLRYKVQVSVCDCLESFLSFVFVPGFLCLIL